MHEALETPYRRGMVAGPRNGRVPKAITARVLELIGSPAVVVAEVRDISPKEKGCQCGNCLFCKARSLFGGNHPEVIGVFNDQGLPVEIPGALLSHPSR